MSEKGSVFGCAVHAGASERLRGKRCVLKRGQPGYPPAFEVIPSPPKELYAVGEVAALREGLAVIGARKATPYGISCARRFAALAAEKGIVVVSGGARGCDRAAHEAALAVGGTTVAFLGGGCDRPYPREHEGLFQRIVDGGGAVVSEQPWCRNPRPWMFRLRNRLIAGMAKATLIVEAGLPSGTFSTADEALAAGKEVLAVPGAVTSPASAGANRLIAQGAVPIIDDDSFEDALFLLFGALKRPLDDHGGSVSCAEDPLLEACRAEPLSLDELVACAFAGDLGAMGPSEVAARVAELEAQGLVARYPDGRFGPQR